MALLRLGIADKGSEPANLRNYLKWIHASLTPGLQRKNMFRDESQWRSLNTIPGKEVHEVQEFLMEAGFLPKGNPDGIFGYRTRAGVRLFQEYVRSVEGNKSIGTPDGMVGNGTRSHMKRWKDNKFVSDWGKASVQNQSIEYTRWMNILKELKKTYLVKKNPILEMVDNFPKKSDTLKVKDWNFDDDEIHLLGIRRNFEQRFTGNRTTDDVFILLINGMVFKFWGSTDPSPKMVSRSDEAFLVEGQHKYRIGWHKISSVEKAYMALKPATNGVLVYRDVQGANALTAANVKAGLHGPNNTINIHWSGIGSFNFSAGCQVIAGASYINHKDQVVDCTSYASKSYAGMKKVAGKPRKTKGAYNVIADLVAVYRPAEKSNIYFTLGRDSTLNDATGFDASFAKTLLDRMKR